MRRILWVVVTVALAGCGSDKLNTAFAGIWTGPATLTMGATMGAYTATENVQLTATLPSETTLTISPVCPGNTGSLTATGSGDSASWTGTVTCPPFAVGPCASVTVTLNNGTGSLSSDGKTLTLRATGTASGCSTTASFSWDFSGVK